MKILSLLLIWLFPIIGFSQRNYSLSGTAQYAFNEPMIGISTIMEESLASFEGHFLLDKRGEPNIQVKLGITLFSNCSSRLLLYPLYFNYKEGDYFTPIGIAWTTTKGRTTFNVGWDMYKQHETIDGVIIKGKLKPNLNASMNIRVFGKRYKK